MAEYTIKAVSDKPASEWQGPHGTVYYKRVMLEGHDKPVEIGKKAPDILKVGMTVSGDIKPDRGEADKFKAAPMAQASFSGGSSASKPAYQPKDEHAIAKAVALKAAVDLLGTSVNVEEVIKVSNEFLAWLEADKPKLDTTPDPMDNVHQKNPMNPAITDEFGDGTEYVQNDELPPGL